MKVAYFTDNYLPATNGIVTYIINTKKELEKRGHEVFVVAPNYPNQKEEKNIIRVKSFSFPLIKQDRFITPFESIPNSLERPDIIHCHLFTTTFMALRYAKKNAVPTVVTYHTLFTDYVRRIYPPAQKISYPIVKLITKWYFDKFDAVIAPSQKVVRALKEAGVKTKIYQVNNAINLKEFQDKNDTLFRKKFNVSQKYIISVSTLDKGKNVQLAVEAMPTVLKNFPNIKLVIAGEGNEGQKLNKLVQKLGLTSNVLFTGFLKRDEVASAYKGAEFSLELSVVDTLPTVATEAATTGKALVALKDDAMVDIVKNDVNGLVIEKPNPQELANAMIKLLKDPKLLNRYSKGSLDIVKNFSIEHYVDKLEKIYREVINTKIP